MKLQGYAVINLRTGDGPQSITPTEVPVIVLGFDDKGQPFGFPVESFAHEYTKARPELTELFQPGELMSLSYFQLRFITPAVALESFPSFKAWDAIVT